MAHVSLYRKYRSQTFGDLIGQAHVTKTLQNSLASGKIAHSFLFTGPRGTGKTSTARLLAKALNCVSGPAAEPCNTCEHCIAITEGSSLDVFEMDAASESTVEDVREKIIAASEYKPASCRYRVFIIDEVHDLSAKAFDALLKTIEEPPEHIIFVLATTEYSKVPPTIRSRCQKYDFHRATLNDLVQRLQTVADAEGVKADPGALLAIARLADGGFRDALTLLEQAMIMAEGEVTIQVVMDQLGLIPEDIVDRLIESAVSGDTKGTLEQLDAIYLTGRDPRSILDSMMYRITDLTRALFGVETHSPEGSQAAMLTSVASRIGAANLARVRAKIAEAQKSVREVSLPRLWLEAELVGLGFAPAPAIAAPAPQPAARVHEPKATKPSTESIPQKAVAVEPEPVKRAAPVANSPVEAAWNRTREAMGKISPTARLRLERTSVALDEAAGVATVRFERQVDLDWVTDKPKFVPMLQSKWAESLETQDWKLVLIVDGAAPEPAVESSAMEFPAEGEKLDQLGRETLGDL